MASRLATSRSARDNAANRRAELRVREPRPGWTRAAPTVTRRRPVQRPVERRREAGTKTDAHGLPSASQTRPGLVGSAGNWATIDAVVASKSRMCMHSVTPVPSASASVGAPTTGPSLPGAPHAPLPWSRRWATTARTPARRATSETSGSRLRVDEGPAGGETAVGEPRRCPRVAPAVEVRARQHIRRGPRPVAPQRQAVGDGAASDDRARRHDRPDVSSTHADALSAIRRPDQ